MSRIKMAVIITLAAAGLAGAGAAVAASGGAAVAASGGAGHAEAYAPATWFRG